MDYEEGTSYKIRKVWAQKHVKELTFTLVKLFYVLEGKLVSFSNAAEILPVVCSHPKFLKQRRKMTCYVCLETGSSSNRIVWFWHVNILFHDTPHLQLIGVSLAPHPVAPIRTLPWNFWVWGMDKKWQSFFHSGCVGSTTWVFMFLVCGGRN